MKKEEMKVYESPQMEVIELQAGLSLLAGSTTSETEDLEEYEMP